MRQHDTLGTTRGAGGIDKCCQVIGVGAGRKFFNIVSGGKPVLHAAVGDMTEAYAFVGFTGEHNLTQVRQINSGCGQRIPTRKVNRNEEFGTAVVENVVRVAGRVGGM